MIQSDRDQFTGLHLTVPVKEAFREEAKARKKSMSELGATWIEEKLKECGREIRLPARAEGEVQLPFEEESRC